MIQRHSIILWKEIKKEKNFEEIAQEAFDLFKVFDKYSEEYRPNYLTATTKRDITKFSWNLEDFKEVLLKGRNKEDNSVFEDMGYHISFFSSLNEKKSCGFELRTGCKKENFYDVLVLNLPSELDCFECKNAEQIKDLFNMLIQKYKPFWGCVSNRILSRQYGKYLEGYMPIMLHWINYWSKEIVDTIGTEKIQKVIRENIDVSFEKGILIIKDTALNVGVEADIEYHKKLQNELLI